MSDHDGESSSEVEHLHFLCMMDVDGEVDMLTLAAGENWLEWNEAEKHRPCILSLSTDDTKGENKIPPTHKDINSKRKERRCYLCFDVDGSVLTIKDMRDPVPDDYEPDANSSDWSTMIEKQDSEGKVALVRRQMKVAQDQDHIVFVDSAGVVHLSFLYRYVAEPAVSPVTAAPSPIQYDEIRNGNYSHENGKHNDEADADDEVGYPFDPIEVVKAANSGGSSESHDSSKSQKAKKSIRKGGETSKFNANPHWLQKRDKEDVMESTLNEDDPPSPATSSNSAPEIETQLQVKPLETATLSALTAARTRVSLSKSANQMSEKELSQLSTQSDCDEDMQVDSSDHSRGTASEPELNKYAVQTDSAVRADSVLAAGLLTQPADDVDDDDATVDPLEVADAHIDEAWAEDKTGAPMDIEIHIKGTSPTKHTTPSVNNDEGSGVEYRELEPSTPASANVPTSKSSESLCSPNLLGGETTKDAAAATRTKIAEQVEPRHPAEGSLIGQDGLLVVGNTSTSINPVEQNAKDTGVTEEMQQDTGVTEEMQPAAFSDVTTGSPSVVPDQDQDDDETKGIDMQQTLSGKSERSRSRVVKAKVGDLSLEADDSVPQENQKRTKTGVLGKHALPARNETKKMTGRRNMQLARASSPVSGSPAALLDGNASASTRKTTRKQKSVTKKDDLSGDTVVPTQVAHRAGDFVGTSATPKPSKTTAGSVAIESDFAGPNEDMGLQKDTVLTQSHTSKAKPLRKRKGVPEKDQPALDINDKTKVLERMPVSVAEEAKNIPGTLKVARTHRAAQRMATPAAADTLEHVQLPRAKRARRTPTKAVSGRGSSPSEGSENEEGNAIRILATGFDLDSKQKEVSLNPCFQPNLSGFLTLGRSLPVDGH